MSAISEPRQSRQVRVQQRAFGQLVADGTYGADFEHAAPAQSFFRECMREALDTVYRGEPLSVLDCGCGPGAWLEFVAGMDAERHVASLYGFDLTAEMVALAKDRLKDCGLQTHLRDGDILVDASYRFENRTDRFDVIFAYDVVQQLPRTRQVAACERVVGHLAPGGIAIIFDNDKNTRFGRRMGFRKFVTKYLGVPLVPRYYCNARYPALSKVAARFHAKEGQRSWIRVAPDSPKRAMFIRCG